MGDRLEDQVFISKSSEEVSLTAETLFPLGSMVYLYRARDIWDLFGNLSYIEHHQMSILLESYNEHLIFV